MILNLRQKQPKALMLLGMAFLALANVAGVFLPRMTHFSEQVVDGTHGFLLGVAIALLILHLRTNGPRRSSGECCNG